jgi:hypothetical protein
MNANEPIYLSYTDADGVAPFFQTLDGKAGFDLAKQGAEIFKRTATVIHTRGQGDDPAIEIVCVTEKPLTEDEAMSVSQAAVNYAMETGLMAFKRGGQNGPSPI